MISSIESDDWLSVILFLPAVLLSLLLVLFLTRKTESDPVTVPRPPLEGGILLGWCLVYFLLSVLTKGEGFLAGEFTKWLWFVILPVALVFLARMRNIDFKGILHSIGLRRRGLGKSILFGLAAYAVFLPVLFFIIPESQLETLKSLSQQPLNLLIAVPVSLLFSLVTAGLTEEIFFRGIIQSRLSILMKSEMRGCLIAAFLFGIYHLPYAYFSESWPTHGNLLWATGSVLAEQMVTGLLLGVLWMRTRNLAASVTLHTLVNTIAIMTMINFG